MNSDLERILKIFGRLTCLEGKLNPEVSATELTEKVFDRFKMLLEETR